MKVLKISLPHGRSAEIGVVGPDDGKAVLYFHSPSASGEELEGAASAAEQLQLRLLSVRRPSIACDEPTQFVETVASVTEALALKRRHCSAGRAVRPTCWQHRHALGPTSHQFISCHRFPARSPEPTRYLTSRRGSGRSPTRQLHRPGFPARPHSVTTRPSRHRGRSMSSPSRNPSRSGHQQKIRSWRPTSSSTWPGDCPSHPVPVPGEHDWLIENWRTVLDRLQG